jgi:hypothetical protein
MKLQVRIDNSDVNERMVLANELDVALIEGVVHYDQIRRIPLWTMNSRSSAPRTARSGKRERYCLKDGGAAIHPA